MVLRLAWRNIWRNSRRTVVTIAAMAFALWVMVLYSGLISGYLAGMARDVLDYEVGEVQIFAPRYLDDPSLYRRIEGADEIVARLEAEGFRAAPRLMAGALAAHGEQSSGARLYGIDLRRDAGALSISSRVVEGRWLEAGKREAVVGRRLARTLALRPGDEILVLSQGADGSMANDLFTVCGLLASIGDATDRGAIFIEQPVFRELLVVPEGVHQIIVRAPSADDEESLARAAERVEALAPGADVRSWRKLMPTVATMLDSTRSVVYIVFAIVYVAVGILILNAMLMAVFERIREFGVIKALGVGPWLVARVIVVEAAAQSAIAVIIALSLALPAAIYLQRVGLDMTFLSGASVAGLSLPPIWRASFSLSTVSAPVVTLLLIVAAATAIPTWKAARLRPLDAMRFQ